MMGAQSLNVSLEHQAYKTVCGGADSCPEGVDAGPFSLTIS